MLQKIKRAYTDAWLGDIRENDSSAQEWLDRALVFLVPLLVTGQIFLYCLSPLGLILALIIATGVLVVFVMTTVSVISDLPAPIDHKEKEQDH